MTIFKCEQKVEFKVCYGLALIFITSVFGEDKKDVWAKSCVETKKFILVGSEVACLLRTE